jgi:cytochrome P450
MADRLPPGPPLPALVQTVQLARDPVGYLRRNRDRYGPVFRTRFLGFPRFVYVAEPELARRVYATDRGGGLAGEVRRDFLSPLVGDHSLLCLEGEEWLRHRRLLGPAFNKRHVEGYREEIAAIAAEEIERWPADEPLALRPRMQRITLEVILRVVFGVEDAARLEGLRRLLPELIEVGGSYLIWVLPPRSWKAMMRVPGFERLPANPLSRFLRVRRAVDEILYAEVASRRAAGEGARADMLSLLLGERDETGHGLGDEELRDELVTLLEAGHETTATALAWAFERLVRTPRALRRLSGELDEEREGRRGEYLDAVVRETLRARPVVIDTPRLLTEPLDLAGYTIPAGWQVSPAMPLVQDDPTVFADPVEFRPERFLEDGNGARGWIPFGGGKRHCLGSHLALLELEVVIAEVLRRFVPEPADAAPERATLKHVTLVPAELARVTLRRRGSLAPADRPTGPGMVAAAAR